MSDPEPSAAACSSSPPSSLQVSDSAAALNYAFLVHSQKTLTQNLPPRVDNKLLARQKRRRTSPEDHAILEAEYLRNPKPDKIARANIVSRVTLGEKEVQIWFQNRRQNDRRKSKPLQPHELVAPRAGGDVLKQMSSDDGGSAEPGSSSGAEQNEDTTVDNNIPGTQSSENVSFESEGTYGDKDEPEQPVMSSQTSLASSRLFDDVQEVSGGSQPDPKLTQPQETVLSDEQEQQQQSAKRKRSESDLRGDRPSGEDGSAPTDGQEGVKSPPSLRISLSFDGEAMVRKQGELTPSPPKGRNALRIAMSSDGKAVIRGEGEPSPSKNRISMFSTRKPRFPALRRCNSAMVLGTPRGGGSAEKERTFGRSRDPRNWESFFDTDARSALSTPNTPNTSSPGLFRSGSQRSLTRSLSARKNNIFTSSDHLSTPVPQQARDKRRKISRTVSSLGRLETGRGLNGVPDSAKSSKLLGSLSKDDEDLEFHGDSDKENWIPGTRMSHVRRRATTVNQRPALKEANGRESRFNEHLASGRRSRLSQPSHRRLNAGNGKDAPEVDAEVSTFMGGRGSASQEEDLDCIQGLLSLSQGAWR